MYHLLRLKDKICEKQTCINIKAEPRTILSFMCVCDQKTLKHVYFKVMKSLDLALALPSLSHLSSQLTLTHQRGHRRDFMQHSLKTTEVYQIPLFYR